MGNSILTYQVKLYPDLSAAALRARETSELAMWYCLKSLNSTASQQTPETSQAGTPVDWQSFIRTGSGSLPLENALIGLREVFGYSRSAAYRHINRAKGRFLDITTKNRRATIEIYGLKRVCEYFTIPGLRDKHYRVVEASNFDSPGHRRAEIYASVHRPQGIKANPMTRACISDMTGLHKVQQRRYEKAAGVHRTPNYAFYRDSSPLGQGKYIPQKIQVKTANGIKELNKRLGNSYHSRQLPGQTGMLKKVNRELRSCGADEAQSLTKLFFASFRKLSKAITSRTRKANEGFYLIHRTKRLIKGRLEWCFTSI